MVVVFTFRLLGLGAAVENVVRVALVDVGAVCVHISLFCSNKDGTLSTSFNCGIENTISRGRCVFRPVTGIFDWSIVGSNVGVRVV